MTNWGSFKPESVEAFERGLQSPANYMVVAPALASRAAYSNPNLMFDDEEEEEEFGYENEDEEEEEEEEEFEPNGPMAMSQLRLMASDIMRILSNMTPYDNLEPWVAAKITMSSQNMSSVADYLEYGEDY